MAHELRFCADMDTCKTYVALQFVLLAALLVAAPDGVRAQAADSQAVEGTEMSSAPASKATPGSKREKKARPERKQNSPRILSPREQFDVFGAVVNSLPRPKNVTAIGSSDEHPLAGYLATALDVSWVEHDSLSVLALSDSLLPATWRLSPELPEPSPAWNATAYFLATGYYRLGLEQRALQWFGLLDDQMLSARHNAGIRHMLVRHYTLAADTAALGQLATSWRQIHTRGDRGWNASLALMAGLFLTGQQDALQRFAGEFRTFAWHATLFRALEHYRKNNLFDAKNDVSQFLLMVRGDSRQDYPLSLKLTALLLAVNIDWESGMDSQARREYELLTKVPHPYVRSWSHFMLGNIAMHNGEYVTADQQFRRLCSAPEKGLWQEIACNLQRHSGQMIERLQKEAVR